MTDFAKSFPVETISPDFYPHTFSKKKDVSSQLKGI